MGRKRISQLTIKEREIIEKRLDENVVATLIAEELGRTPSGIYREIKKGWDGEKYSAKLAEENTLKNNCKRGRKPDSVSEVSL